VGDIRVGLGRTYVSTIEYFVVSFIVLKVFYVQIMTGDTLRLRLACQMVPALFGEFLTPALQPGDSANDANRDGSVVRSRSSTEWLYPATV
jgi:hypothetical protein